MIPIAEACEHLAALALVWGFAIAGGLPLIPCLPSTLRNREPFLSAVLMGIALWAVLLYALPFEGGLDVGMAMLTATSAATAWRKRSRIGLSSHYSSRALLLVGCVVFITPLLTQHVPPGMDASMHSTTARLIAQNRGLPATYAPFAPTVPFPAVNLGLPALAATAVRFGCKATSAILAAEQLTYSSLIFATYLLLRLYLGRMPSAVLATASVWFGRGVQDAFAWGGVPTVASIAVGLFAARLLIDVIRYGVLSAAVPLGIAVAALPMLHGVSAAVWVYSAGPAALLAGASLSRRRMAGLQAALAAGGTTAGLLAAYLCIGLPEMGNDDVRWIRDWQALFAPKGEGGMLLVNAPSFLIGGAGEIFGWLGVAATISFVVGARKRLAKLFSLLFLDLAILAVNSRFWVLPGSSLLYPERVVYWLLPWAALAIGAAWRCRRAWVRPAFARFALAGVLLVVAGARHLHYFQRVALRPTISADDWALLCWSSRQLDPRTAFVEAPYASAGSYLPAVAGIATTGWHVHLTCLKANDSMRDSRAITHRCIDARNKAQHGEHAADDVAFQYGSILLIRAAPTAE